MITIYSDGACSGNPGPGGWGAVILSGDRVLDEIYGGENPTTNNRMEMMAVIAALQAQSGAEPICVITDSSYVKDGITRWIAGWKRNGWRTSQKKPVKNQDLWQEIDQQSQRLTIEWQWIKGHAGHRWNERADALARLGAQEAR